MPKINISRNEFAYQSVLHYCSQFVKDNDESEYILKDGSINRTRNKDIINFYLFPKDEVTIVNYKDKEICISHTYEGAPVALDHAIERYSEIVIWCDDFELLQLFIKESIQYRRDTIMEQGPEGDKIMCWIWDDYWENVYKRKKRKLESISLNGKEVDVLDNMKHFLSKETEDKYNLLGIPYKKNYIFEGLPGTGKTSLIYAIASELNKDIAILNFNRDFDDVQFMKSIQHIPEDTILVLEDIDVLFQERKHNDEHKHGITFSGLFNVLDGLGHQDKLITIMTTNYMNRLDKALIRPGRVDYCLHFDYATKEQIRQMFLRFFPGKTEECDEFLLYIKKYKLKLTTAILQQFLFTNMYKDNVMEDINKLEELVNSNNYKEKPDGFYN